MTERQRLMAVLDGSPVDKLPWFADLSYLYTSMDVRGTLESRFKGGDGYLRFHRELGAGICFYAPWLWEYENTGGVTEKVEDSGDLRIFTIATPIGTVREVQKQMPLSFTLAIVEHYVKDLDDLKVLLYASEHRKFRPEYARYLAEDAAWGEYGYAVGLAPIADAPIQRLLTRWAGVIPTMDLYMDHQEELESIMVALEEADTPMFEILCGSPCRLVEFPENLSAEITGRTFFEKYNLPYYSRRISAMHSAGIKTGIHNDGTMLGTFDLLKKCGFDVIESVTPAPVGDISLENLRGEAGSDIVLWGGLPGAMFSPVYSDELFESHLQEAVRIFKADGRCVLGVADQVPPDGLISRVKRVREVVEA